MPTSLLRIGFLLFATAPAYAQFGNEWIFVGKTGSEAYAFVDSATGAVVNGTSIQARNIRGTEFADLGQNLYVANAAPVFSITGISRAQWNGAVATWSPFYWVPDASYCLGLDRTRQRIWVLTGNATAGRELHCVDANPNSGTYGQLLAQTTTLGPTVRERWAMSRSGNLAAVPAGQVGMNQFDIVDTNPASPTFLQVIVRKQLSATSPGSGYIMACAVSDDDRYAYTLVPGVAPYVGVLDIPAQTWLDFDPAPGQQHLMLPQTTPNYMALAPDASYLVITGGSVGLGWVRRVVFDYANPSQSTMASVLQGAAMWNAAAPSVSFDSSRYAFLANSGLNVVDAATGNQLLFVAGVGGLFSAWQDLRATASYRRAYVEFGAGCPGATGTPTLVADAATPSPAIGQTFSLTIGNIPLGVALVGFGFSNTAYNGLPLPLPLDTLGMPGCSLLASPDILTPVFGLPTASGSLSVPNTLTLYGLPFFNQAFALDATANALGITTSNAGAAIVGN